MSKIRAKKYTMPAGLNAGSIIIRELLSKDEIAAAIAADGRMSNDDRNNAVLALTIERKEAIRISIVAIDGRLVNTDGVPCMEIDDWTIRSWTALSKFFGEMNGIPGDELGKAVEGAVDVDLDALTPSLKADGTGK